MGIVDISEKKITLREAIARGRIYFDKKTYSYIKKGRVPKGDIFEITKVAIIMAVKNTPQIVPHCHNILIEDIKVEFEKNDKEFFLEIRVKVKARAKTGVEMEAITGVSAGLITIYDLLKFSSKEMKISDIELLFKKGGKSGTYRKDKVNINF